MSDIPTLEELQRMTLDDARQHLRELRLMYWIAREEGIDQDPAVWADWRDRYNEVAAQVKAGRIPDPDAIRELYEDVVEYGLG